MRLRMGTRGSALALAQSGQLAGRLKAVTPGLEVEAVVIRTSGDRFSAAAPDQPGAPPGGAKGLFVKEIEDALLRGEIDFAVHSAKDLPAELAPGCVVAAYPERADPSDALIAPGGAGLEALPKGARVATASLRRQLQLKRLRPDLEFVAMRGNVDTRLRKLAEGACDALLLAEAGLARLGQAVARRRLDVNVLVPAPGQGALAVETREMAVAMPIVHALDHADTRAAVEFEREVLRLASGSCFTPLGVHARRDGSVWLADGFLCEADGTGARRAARRGLDPAAMAADLRR